MLTRVVRAAVGLALAGGLLVPLQALAAPCGLASRPAPSAKHVRTGHPETARVRLYGDSITYQVLRRALERNPGLGADVFWGQRTAPTVDALVADARRSTPELVVVAIGTNDTGDPSGVEHQVKRARAALPPSTRLLWVNTYVETNDGWRDVDAAIARTPGVEIVDWALVNLRAKGLSSRSPLLQDGVHLSCAGGEAWMDLVQRAMDSASTPHHAGPSGTHVVGEYQSQPWGVAADLPAELRPYARRAPLPATGSGLTDRSGVRMARVGGDLVDEPGAQASYGIALLESHRLTGKPGYLDLAQRQADRLLSRRVVTPGGWFYPYPFDGRAPDGQVLRAPWYSATAQGLALSLLSRLGTVTADPSYRLAADATFASLLLPPGQGRPWVTRVSENQLWFEARPTGTSGTRTLLGHLAGLYGVHDYWAATGDAVAQELLRGALTTAAHAGARVRVPGGTSRDGVVLDAASAPAHRERVRQLLVLFGLTGDSRFAALADLLHADDPGSGAPARVVLEGEVTGYALERSGLGEPVTVSTQRRVDSRARTVRIPGRAGTWLLLSEGPLAGRVVREQPGLAYRLGTADVIEYPLPRTGTMKARVLRLHRVDDVGQRTAYDVDLRPGERISVDRRAVQDGVQRLRIAEGLHARWWVDASAVRLG